MKKQKNGVSLITLVITIIIMVILASAVIITLSSSEIIDKANDGVKASDIKQVEYIATLAWSEAYIDGKDLQEAVDEALRKNNLDDKYYVEATNNGVKVTLLSDLNNYIEVPEEWAENVWKYTSDEVPIPKGFVKSPYPGEATKAEGLVIYALTDEEIANGKTDISDDVNKQYSLENRNQFVWVPVDSTKFETLFKRQFGYSSGHEYSNEYIITDSWQAVDDNTGYYEVVLGADNMPLDETVNTTEYMSPSTFQEVRSMYASVKKYGGFYVARYEVGKDDLDQVSITMGKYPYNNIAWGIEQGKEGTENTAVAISRNFYNSSNSSYGAASTLMYGVQWDRTLAWAEESLVAAGINNTILRYMMDRGIYSGNSFGKDDYNSKAKYNKQYYDDEGELKYTGWISVAGETVGTRIYTTGAINKSVMNNIYDMAGNLAEITMEMGNYWGEGMTMTTRGSYAFADDTPQVTARMAIKFNETKERAGFRPALYIK